MPALYALLCMIQCTIQGNAEPCCCGNRLLCLQRFNHTKPWTAGSQTARPSPGTSRPEHNSLASRRLSIHSTGRSGPRMGLFCAAQVQTHSKPLDARQDDSAQQQRPEDGMASAAVKFPIPSHRHLRQHNHRRHVDPTRQSGVSVQ